MKRPPKERGGLPTALNIVQLRGTYRLLSLLQGPFRFLFWKIERCKARLLDRIDNQRSGR